LTTKERGAKRPKVDMEMTRKRILYISGSLGLGHIVRDIAIAKELRRQKPEVEISWLAAHPASLLLKEAGEKLLPEAEQYANDNITAEHIAIGFRLNLLKYLSNARREWENNIEVFKHVIGRKHFDLVISDEAYEIGIALQKKHVLMEAPFVMIYDFVGCDSTTNNPIEKLGIYMWNRIWVQGSRLFSGGNNLALFIGQPEDIPDNGFGVFLPNRRDYAKAYYKFIGYVLPFNPAEYADKARIRAKLGYGEETLVVCSVGGTSIGKNLLELCGKTYPIIREKVPDLRMVLVCGPRLSVKSLQVPEGVEVRGYVPALYEHFAASDLAIVQGGATTTLELTALRRLFVFFPLEGHFEQQVHVAGRLDRHKAGIKMSYDKTTPDVLADKVISNLGKEINYPPISTDGDQKAAGLIKQLLEK